MEGLDTCHLLSLQPNAPAIERTGMVPLSASTSGDRADAIRRDIAALASDLQSEALQTKSFELLDRMEELRRGPKGDPIVSLLADLADRLGWVSQQANDLDTKAVADDLVRIVKECRQGIIEDCRIEQAARRRKFFPPQLNCSLLWAQDAERHFPGQSEATPIEVQVATPTMMDTDSDTDMDESPTGRKALTIAIEDEGPTEGISMIPAMSGLLVQAEASPLFAGNFGEQVQYA